MLWGGVNPRVGQLYSQPDGIKIFRDIICTCSLSLFLSILCGRIMLFGSPTVMFKGKKQPYGLIEVWWNQELTHWLCALRSSLPIDWDDLELHLHIARLLEGGSCSNEGWIWGVRLASKWMTQLAVCRGSVKVQLCNSSFVKVAEIPHVDWSFPNTISCCVGYIWAWRISTHDVSILFILNSELWLCWTG